MAALINKMRQLKIFSAFTAIFLTAYFLPLSYPKFQAAILEAFRMLQWYARNHTLACVVPALALLLAGPALSLPSILVIRSVLGIKKTMVSTSLVILMATAAGLIYGLLIEGGVT